MQAKTQNDDLGGLTPLTNSYDGDAEGLAWQCTEISCDTTKDWSKNGAQW